MIWSARILLHSLLVLLSICTIQAAGEDATKVPAQAGFELSITEQDVRPHIEFLASPEMKGRSGDEAIRAGEYLKDHFEKLGLKPLFEESFFQPIPGTEREDGTFPTVGRNVGAWLPGSDPDLAGEFIIVSAHYDHLGMRGGRIHPGADDNASGVAMMLEVVRKLATADQPPRRSVAFVGFDLEENMLWGSRWFAAHPPWPLEQLKLFITADMIGRSLGDLPLPTVFVLGSEYAPRLKQVLDDVGEPDGLEVARMGVDLIGTRSDYGPFRDRQVPFLFFSTGEHPDYHTARDVPEKIEYSKVAGTSSLVLRIVRQVANSDDAPEWTSTPESDLDEVRALHRITALLLKAEDERPLTDLQRFMVSNVQNRTKQILARGKISPTERQWLIRTAQLLLLSVF